MKNNNMKYKVVIIDDEPLVLEGLKDMIDWAEYDYEIVGVFEQSEKALIFILNNTIDLVITDIRMPGLDGLELIKLLKKEKPLVHILIMSGFRDFEYVKKAMTYGATKYLVKPIFDEDICAVLKSLKQQFEKLQQESYYYEFSQNERLKLYLSNQIVNDDINQMKTYYNNLFISNEWFLLILWKGYEGINKKERSKIFEEIVENSNYIELLHEQHSMILLIQEDRKESLHKLTMQSIISKWKITGCVSSFDDLELYYQQEFDSLHYYHHLQNNISPSESSEIKSLKTWIKNFVEALNTQNQEKLTNLICGYVESMSVEKVTLNQATHNTIELYSLIVEEISKIVSIDDELTKLSNMKNNSHYMTYENILIFLESKLSILFESVNKAQEMYRDSFKTMIEDYIDCHYNEDLLIKDLADLTHMHPAYLGQKLNQLWGESFTNHLHRVRINKAVNMIKQDHNAQLKEIATNVGYYHYHLFLKYFKKYMNKTPKDFIK